jgi:hypothetical protein
MAVEFRGSENRNIQYGGSRSPRKQERLPQQRKAPKNKTDYGANKLPSIKKLEELNALPEATVRALVKQGKLDRLINDITDLKVLDSPVLQILFQHGRDPNPDLFNGSMRGTDLAAPHHDDTWFGKLIDTIMTSWRPWAGKQTIDRPGEGHEGTGNNKVFGKWIFNFNWAVTETKLGKNFAGDGAKVIRLDYGTPDDLLNKLTGVNCVHDEVREVGRKGSGVMLGMAALAPNSKFWSSVFNGLLRIAGREERVKPGNDPVPVIYFGLQGNQPK